MTLAELLALLEKAPAAVATMVAAGTAASFVLGACGTAIEHVGAHVGWRFLERAGQTIEAVFADIPKILRGSRQTAQINAAIDAHLKRLPVQPESE